LLLSFSVIFTIFPLFFLFSYDYFRNGTSYIPNDVELGGIQQVSEDTAFLPRTLLLTGPNMGGKSTLLRQTCLVIILAQIGCRVPADECTLTPVDRIFTRVGASDRILAGQSTFFVELAETSLILKAASEDSLCILDELGRGTATFDGTAIAHAVVDHLVSKIRCRALFATHYHLLVEDWEIDPRVKLGHMDCFVHNQEEEAMSSNNKKKDEEMPSEQVTFLYKLCSGSSPKSYGINVARLAGMPDTVIQLALKQSSEFEEKSKTTLEMNGFISKISSVFERIVSISAMIDEEKQKPVVLKKEELVYLVEEIWKRYSVMKNYIHE
jgi:DNA mismatch repair protein MSH6